MVNKQLYQLIEYARRTPHFAQLQREDQITLLRAGWNELLIATVAWRSIEVCADVHFSCCSFFLLISFLFSAISDHFTFLFLLLNLQFLDQERTNADGSIDRRAPVRPPQLMCLGPNFTLHRNSAHQAGVAPIFDRILSELSVKMKRLNIDRAELTCLKAIILFNPGMLE